MKWSEILEPWSKSKNNPDREGSTHKEFAQEMTRKTVINRACKRYLNSSDDGSLLMYHVNRADEVAAEAEVEAEIEESANQELIDIEYEVAEDEEENNTEAEEQVEEEKPVEKPKQSKQQTMEGPGF